MDPLLRELECNSLGPFVYGTYTDAFAHADDICTVTSSLLSLQQQIRMVQNFAEENALSLNPAKCEILIVSPLQTCIFNTCLHHCWPITSPKRECQVPWILVVMASLSHQSGRQSHQESQKGLLHLWGNGSLPRQTQSGKNIFDTCFVPVLLFGSENWILTDSQLNHLEAFMGEIGRRILKLPKSHSTLATRDALKFPLVTARILTRNLNLFSKVSSEVESIGCRMYNPDTLSLRLIEVCLSWSLENKLDCHGAIDLFLKAD